jgi:hypothetical protein
VGDVAKAAGVGHSLKFRGKSYELKPETPEMVGRFEVWIEDGAWSAAKRAAKRFKNRAEYDAYLREERRDIASGTYSYGSEYYGRASRTMAGFRQRLYLALHAGDPDVTEELVAAMTDEKGDPAAFAEAVRLMSLRDGAFADGGEDEAGDDAGAGGE